MRRVLTTLSLLAVLVAATLAAASPARAAPTLAVFGDSFSLTLRDGVRDWPALLQQRGLVGRIANSPCPAAPPRPGPAAASRSRSTAGSAPAGRAG